MAKQLLGKEVTAALNTRLQARVEALKVKGITPKLGIIRCGERPDIGNGFRVEDKKRFHVPVREFHFVIMGSVAKVGNTVFRKKKGVVVL